MSEVYTRQYVNVAGLVLLIYDQVLTWSQEVKWIWRTSGWTVKVTFFVARYCALITQIINLTYTHPSVLKKQVVGCHAWFAFQTSAVGLLLCNFELTLMIRVYALYNRNLRIGVFLVSWYLLSLGLNIWIGSASIHKMELDSNCIMVVTPGGETMSFSLMVVSNQCILWGLTSYKYRDAIRNGWSRNPIIHLVMRDSTWCFAALSALFIPLLPYSLLVEQIGHIIYCLLTSLLSLMTCRIILNMRSLSVSGDPSDPVFTTDQLAME